MLDGLYPYEVVILCAGAIFFVILTWAFVFQIRAGSLGASLVMFFMIDIAMIGFPAFKEFQYKDGVITLEKDASELQDEPTNSALRSSLGKTLQAVLPRALSGRANAKNLVTVATAQYELGKEAGAKKTLRRALSEDQSAPEALELKQKIETVDRVQDLTVKLKADPADSKTSAELREAVQQVTNMKLANPRALTIVAKAQENLGDHKGAAATGEKAQAIFQSDGDVRRSSAFGPTSTVTLSNTGTHPHGHGNGVSGLTSVPSGHSTGSPHH